ncbi:hypothetical protein [Acidipila sp. EB88]|uniref:hypothetical protein n=1 Tax=Acidipila sp. EB88 TaxID=2305226 RepID=UPI000F5E28CA|nr:hypothetical protein [Acidipila sp. EB88]RRA48057.1 hypothetical protein D1Y84_06895 [Acidipila sp. EB88]
MSLTLPHLSDAAVRALVADVNRKGFACVPNYIDPESLARMQAFVHGAVREAGNQYVGFAGPDAVAGSGLDEVYHSPEFAKLMRNMYEFGTGKSAPREDFYQVLRCLAGETGQRHAWMFHYDSYVVTALVPIVIPTEGKSGDLLMFPNTRSIRPAYLLNAADKVLLDNRLTQKLLRRSVERDPDRPTRIKMQPGTLYFFWGYRSIHTNEPCDPDKVRATALFHYANPHRKVKAAS